MQIRANQLLETLSGSDELLRNGIGRVVRAEHGYVVDGLPQDLFDQMIDSGIVVARRHGLTRATDLGTFVLLMFEFGPEFHRHPEIQRTLSATNGTPAARLAQVVDSTPSEVWRQLTAVLHRQTWFPELRTPLPGVD